MVNEKHAFLAVALMVAVFICFLLLSRGNAASAPAAAGLAAMPIDNSIPVNTGGAQDANAGQQLQVVSVRALSSGGYDNPGPTVRAGFPVEFDFSADPGSGCGRQLLIDGLGTRINLISRSGETVSATFTPPSPGQYRFHCGMNMFRGVLTAT